MRITKIILRNWIGIRDGLGRPEIEVNFERNHKGEKIKRNRVVMLVGANGSGKTTLLSSLHPFSTNGDSRPTFIVPGQEGYKEIHYADGKTKYVIRHHYGQSTKSYISKDGKELNESGGVRSFEDVIKREFGIDKEYFRIGRIGSNVAGFIDLPAGMRKKFIGNFLPDVDEYLRLYKVANEKFKTYKTKISYVSDNLQKLNTEENLNQTLEALEGQAAAIRKRMADLDADIARNKGRIDSLDPDGALSENRNPVQSAFEQALRELRESKKTIEAHILKYPKLAAYDLAKAKEEASKSAERIVALESEKAVLESKIEECNKAAAAAANRKKDAQSEFGEMSSRQNAEELNALLSKIEKKLNKAALAAGKSLEGLDENVSIDSLLPVKNALDSACESLLGIKSSYSEEDVAYFVKQYVAAQSPEASLAGDVARLEERAEALARQANTARIAMEQIKNQRKELKKLSLRPAKCKIDDCPFIVYAVKYKDRDFDSEIAEQERKASEADADAEKVSNRKARAGRMGLILKEVSLAHRSVLKAFSDNGIEPFGAAASFKTFAETLSSDINSLKSEFNIDEIVETLAACRDVEILTAQKAEIVEKLLLMKDRESLIESVNSAIRNAEKEISEKTSEAEALAEKAAEIDGLLSKERKRKSILSEFKSALVAVKRARRTMRENKEEYDKNKVKMSKISDLLEEIREAEKAKEAEAALCAPVEARAEQTRFSIGKISELKAELAELEAGFENVKLVHEALNPIKGIPVHFIEGYLSSTKRIANELLALAFKERFRVKFEVDEKEFKIRVLTANGEAKDDILECSQGEVAITSISISLALIEQMLSRYNVVCLDEIDSTLDQQNRRAFTNILETQIEKLGIESMFVISHNNEFYNSNVDLVLLPGHDVDLDGPGMQGKNVLFAT